MEIKLIIFLPLIIAVGLFTLYGIINLIIAIIDLRKEYKKGVKDYIEEYGKKED